MKMNSASLAMDNITGVLVAVLKFTRSRHKLLVSNMTNARTPGYVPMDLPVNEFAEMMERVVDEGAFNGRIAGCCGDNVRFNAQPIVDDYIKHLFENDTKEYMKLQKKKIVENLQNQRVAAELLLEKRSAVSVLTN